DDLPLGLAAEAEPVQELGGAPLALADLDVPPDLLDDLQDPPLRVEFGQFLGQVGEPYGASADDPAGVGVDGAGEQAQHRGLARAVDPDQPHAVAGAELPGAAVEDERTGAGT